MLEALYIALLGMVLIFACLGAVLLVMMALAKLFPAKEGETESKKS